MGRQQSASSGCYLVGSWRLYQGYRGWELGKASRSESRQMGLQAPPEQRWTVFGVRRETRWVSGWQLWTLLQMLCSQSSNRAVIFLERILIRGRSVVERQIPLTKMHHVFEEVAFWGGWSPHLCWLRPSFRLLSFRSAPGSGPSGGWKCTLHITAHVFQGDFHLRLEGSFLFLFFLIECFCINSGDI